MTAYADTPATRANPLVRVESWLDQRGRFAWIAAMVAGFIFVWPVGLALLAYMLWQNKFTLGRTEGRAMGGSGASLRTSSGNAAFDAYRSETLRRLEDEQAAFEDFLKRLREARDKAEFDQFMEDRARHAGRKDEAERESDAA